MRDEFGILHCDMAKQCDASVTHIDNKGFIYCAVHGKERKYTHPTRQLAKWELTWLRRGDPIPSYTRRPMPKPATT